MWPVLNEFYLSWVTAPLAGHLQSYPERMREAQRYAVAARFVWLGAMAAWMTGGLLLLITTVRNNRGYSRAAGVWLLVICCALLGASLLLGHTALKISPYGGLVH
jgi:hypothetical protein